MKFILLSLSIICISNLAFSQEKTDSLKQKSNTTIIKDIRIDKLSETYTATHNLIGYRVQIHSGPKRLPANQVRATFLRVHPKTKAHFDYEQPYYKVRVGDFKTKLEALKYKNFIADEFPNSFIVKDEIDAEELIE
ncbi:MAG: SPOR domain-containing protein [Vicingaceae bacterium]